MSILSMYLKLCFFVAVVGALLALGFRRADASDLRSRHDSKKADRKSPIVWSPTSPAAGRGDRRGC